MKKTLFLFALLAIFACNNNSSNETISDETVQEAETESLAGIFFNETTHDFGVVQAGEMMEYTFDFTNTGQKPLVLSKVTADCGCTTPSYSQEPIKPGSEGKITVTFNSHGFKGNVYKSIRVEANTEQSEYFLYLVCEVK